MVQKNLKNELASEKLRNMYLLFGEERFLVGHYARAIEKTVCGEAGEKTVFGGETSASEIIMAAETLPFNFGAAAEKRLILVSDSRLFAAGRKADSEEIADYLEKIPPDTVLLFVENEIDRRTRAFKKATEIGGAFECTPLSPNDLTKWLARLAKEKNRTLPPATANFLVRTCGTSMANLENEMHKLIFYCDENAEITNADVKAICTPTTESRIFDLTKAVVTNRAADALKLYRDMLILKESPIMVLTMVVRQLRIILLCKCLAEKGVPQSQIERELNLRDFVVKEAVSQGRRFTSEGLLSALEKCLDTDVKIKTGLISQEIGVEMLLLSF